MKTTECIIRGRFREDVSNREWCDWLWQIRHCIRTMPDLAQLLGKSNGNLSEYAQVSEIYPFRITPYYLSLMDMTNKKDPLRLQCFPDIREITFSTGGVPDPLEEERDMPVPGLIHRYPDRCLAIVTSECATRCRHCNRKRLWGSKQPTGKYWYFKPMVDYIETTTRIREVILSGGDPLTLEEDMLEWFIKSLRAIPHVEVLRIGSRVPVVMPMRVTRNLCLMLKKYRPLWLNTQFNHPNEITPMSARACEMLLQAGIPVSSQSVLLKGVNDDFETMRELLYGLQKISVRPYYLFQCEPVRGADHFRTDISTGMKLMEKLWGNVSGLCIPHYVLDTPGGRGKVPLFPLADFIQ